MIIALLISCSLSLIIILLPKNWVTDSNDLTGIQKFHHRPTPRIGGIPVFMSFFIGLWYLDLQEINYIYLLLASLPVFLGGVIEDFIIRLSPLKRFISTVISIVMMFFIFDVNINFLGFDAVDYLLSNSIISLLFTVLIVGGAINAINIIDGFNGLMPGYSIIVLIAIAYVANILGDTLVIQLSLLLILSILGTFIFNFPFGYIFIGDGGAFFIGFMLTMIGLMLGIRNEEVSHWFILLLFIYPLYETAFSVYRKKIVRNSPLSHPDKFHLHMMIYKRLIRGKIFKNNKTIQNSMTSPLLWVLSFVGIIPAVIWNDNQKMLIIWAFIFMIIYTIIYRRIVHFKFRFKK